MSEVDHAKAITAAICELMAAHEAVWHRAAQPSTWDVPRNKLETAITSALRSAGRVEIERDEAREPPTEAEIEAAAGTLFGMEWDTKINRAIVKRALEAAWHWRMRVHEQKPRTEK